MAVQQQPAEYYQVAPASLEAQLHLIVARLRWLRWVRCVSFGGFVGVCVSLVTVVLAHFYLLPDWFMLEVGIPLFIAIGAVAGTVFAFLRPIPMMAAARIAESRLGLKERLSSALEFEPYGRNPRDPEPSLLVRLQQRDAAVYANALHPKQAVPFVWPWQLKAFLISFVVLLLALIIPTLPFMISTGLKLERQIVAKEGDKLAKQARVIEKQADQEQLPHTKWAAQQMKRLGQQMAKGHMDKRQAFVKYGQLTQQMRNIQKQLAQNGSMSNNKTISDAGKKLAQSLQSKSSPNDGQTPGNPKGNPSAQGSPGQAKGNGTGKPGDKNPADKNQHGFNIPNVGTGKPGAQGDETGPNGQHGTPEIQKAAQQMQQGNTMGLSEQLRQLAKKADAGQLNHDQQQQAAQDLQKLADALKGTPMQQTQQHSQAAADAMKQGDTKRAADEMRKAADAAEREMKAARDSQGMQDAQKSLQESQQQTAAAASPAEAGQQQSGDSSQSGNSSSSSQGGQGDSSGEGNNNGQGEGDMKNAENTMKSQGSGGGNGQGDQKGGDEPGAENGGSGSANHEGRGNGHGHQSNPNSKWKRFQGPVTKLNSHFDPSKFPKYAKIYLGKPKNGSAGRLGATMKTRPGAGGAHQVNSSVPYYTYVGGAKKAAESAVDHEDIPPSYKNDVQKYFDSLTPAQK